MLEAVCRINRLLARPLPERRESDDAYAQWEHDAARALFRDHFGEDRLAGLRVLDVACGPGGKTAWYAEAGAASVTGLDLDPTNVAQGARFAAARAVADRVRFVIGDAVRLPFADGAFDALTANDAMEHFAEPAAALADLVRVLRRGGRLYASFPPYRSPHGAHLYDYVHIPWCQNLMSRRLLYGTLRRSIEDAAQARPGGDAAAWAARTYDEQVRFFEDDVNGMTIGWFLALVRATPGLRMARLVCEPPKFGFLRPLTRLPVLREYLTGLVVAELVRS